MTQSSGEFTKVLWAEMFPYELKRKLKDCPIVYLPMGLCEPHGQISAFGLDTIKAEWLCQKAASRVGGVVAPALGYHIHETGYHARWLEEVVGEENPHMTGMPPDVILRFFLYQLRAFVNAGFKGIIVITGHSGGNQYDLRRAAGHFMKHSPVQIRVASDPELVSGLFEGDHAGKYEISQLIYLRRDLVNLPLHLMELEQGSGGRLAVGPDAHQASEEYGETVMHACLEALCREAEALQEWAAGISGNLPRMGYAEVEQAWRDMLHEQTEWQTLKPLQEQQPVSEGSMWKPYQNYLVEKL